MKEEDGLWCRVTGLGEPIVLPVISRIGFTQVCGSCWSPVLTLFLLKNYFLMFHNLSSQVRTTSLAFDYRVN